MSHPADGHAWYWHLRKRGLCVRCRVRAFKGRALCVRCLRLDRLRHRRRPTRHAYGPRVRCTAPVLAVIPAECPRCQGFLLREQVVTHEGDAEQWRCLPCGNVVLVAGVGRVRV